MQNKYLASKIVPRSRSEGVESRSGVLFLLKTALVNRDQEGESRSGSASNLLTGMTPDRDQEGESRSGSAPSAHWNDFPDRDQGAGSRSGSETTSTAFLTLLKPESGKISFHISCSL